MFAIDPRSLAAFRIGVAVLLLCDLFARAADVAVFYTDSGVLPRTVRLEMLGSGDQFGFEHQWSIYMLNGQAWSQRLLMLIAAASAGCLLVGYRTQLAAIASWILLVSLNDRNPLVMDAGDLLLRALLFWSLFLPLGAAWSVDRCIPRPFSTSYRPICSVLSAALLLQLALMYWASAAFKWHPVWIRDFSGVYYALHADTLATRLGHVLREYPTIMRFLTIATVGLEVSGPLLAFCPWRNAWCRGAAVTAFVLFHIGLSLTMHLALFPWICIVAWLLFVPTAFWESLQSRPSIRRVGESLQHNSVALFDRLPRAWRISVMRRAERPRERASLGKQILVAALFLYVVTWNIREVLGPAWVDRIMPHRYNGLAFALGLAQNWSMFAPMPRVDDGWLVIKGTLRDGSEVNLWDPGQPLPWNKPRFVSQMFPSSRWRSYCAIVTSQEFAFHLQHFANWLQARWDREHSAGKLEKKVVKVEIIRMLEPTPPPGEPFAKPEPVEVCVRHY